MFLPGETKTAVIEIENTGNSEINAQNIKLDYAFFPAKFKFINSKVSCQLPDTVLPAGYKKQLSLPVTAPGYAAEYKLLFSFVNGLLPGNFASDFYDVKVN